MRVDKTKKDIWINSYPIFLWLILEPIVGLVDSKIASLIGINSLSAVGVGETIYFVFVWIFIFLAYGTTPLVSAFKTKNQINQLNFLIKFGRQISIFLGSIAFFVLYSTNSYFINIFRPTAVVGELSSSYLILRCVGLPFYLINMHSTAVLRGLKLPKATFNSSLIVTFLNIILSYVFGIVFEFGVMGIGFASSASFLVASIYSTIILKKTQNNFTISSDIVEKQKIRLKFFSVGINILVRSLFLTLFMAFLRNKASLMSMEEIAIQHVLLQLWSIGYIFADSIAIASQTLVSEYISTDKSFSGSKLQKDLYKIIFFLSTSLFIFSFLTLEKLVSLVSSQSLNNLISFELILLFSISLLVGSFAFLWDGVLLALDKSKEFSILTIIASLTGFLVCTILLLKQNSLETLWIALNVSLAIRTYLGYKYQKIS